MAANPTDIEHNTFDAGHDSMRQGWGGTLGPFAACLAELPTVTERIANQTAAHQRIFSSFHHSGEHHAIEPLPHLRRPM